MKLTQRLALRFYKAKFKTLELISARKAGEAAFKLFCTPYSGKPKREAPAIFHKAETLSLKLNGLKVNGWKWVPTSPNGKKILVAHGFDSCSYKFEKYIKLLSEDGFEVYAFDAPGHGVSEGKYIYLPLYKEMILTVDKLYGQFYAVMAHSLGGMAAGVAAEYLPSLQKLIVIAPAVELQTGINNFSERLGLSKNVTKEMEKVIIEVGKQPMSFYSLSRAVQNLSLPILWLHDQKDPICPFSDVQPVVNMNLPHIQFYITKGLGHSNIYKNKDSVKKIISFCKDA